MVSGENDIGFVFSRIFGSTAKKLCYPAVSLHDATVEKMLLGYSIARCCE
jgi:hypothetical protein